MKKISFSSMLLVLMLICSAAAWGQKLKPIRLLKPQTAGGKPLMAALKARESTREFSNKKLAAQTLSNLLWAAFGVNRPDSGKRTAPSAKNWQEISIYVALAEGLYLYDARTHTLEPILAEDLRNAAGIQRFTGDAPVNLIYVADLFRMGNSAPQYKDFYAATDTGFISQNVYLFCASESLATVVLGYVDKAALAKKMGLRSDQRIILTQPVGYPKK
ncbi:MAG: SagB/ThcOx family dehydrogenase [Victivallaceae bacterium]|nr:SagB/ThcOx family dehydrogenase [Victivallaceae bacterium]